QLPRCPIGPDPGAPAHTPEGAAHVPGQKRSADRRCEHEAMLSPPVPRGAAVIFLLLLLLPERLDAQLGQPQRPPGLPSLNIAASAYRSLGGHCPGIQGYVVPAKRSDLLGLKSGEQR